VCGKHAPKAKTITFDDGTSRTTLAAVTSGLSELDPLRLGSLPADDEVATAACSPQFEAAIADFRSTVSEGTHLPIIFPPPSPQGGSQTEPDSFVLLGC